MSAVKLVHLLLFLFFFPPNKNPKNELKLFIHPFGTDIAAAFTFARSDVITVCTSGRGYLQEQVRHQQE